MKDVLKQAASQLNKGHKQKKWWQRAVSMMTAVVVFCTTYALILPALTMESEAICGYEAHEHSEDCYTRQQVTAFACGLEEQAQVLHSHDALCYDDEGSLICPLPEIHGHTHSDGCVLAESVLACGQEETQGHTHTEECSPAETVLTCNLEETAIPDEAAEPGEAAQGHTHGEGCYEVQVTACQIPEAPAHTHSEACWETRQTLVCGMTELAAHTHDETCSDPEGSLTCGIAQAVAHSHTETCLTTETVQTLHCQLPVHIHTETCFPAEEADSSTGYLCGTGVHTHGEGCSDEAGDLICTIPEHTHEAACIVADLDLTADVEDEWQWKQTFADVQLTGHWPTDVLALADTQLGYQESVRNVILAGDALKGYTRYGQWYGDPYGDWCAMFVSFCLHYAGVEDFPLHAGCSAWIEALTEEGRWFTADAYTPKAGDLIFFDYQQTGDPEQEIPVDADHVGIVVELIPATEEEPAKIRTIEGNTGNQVAYVTYEMADPAIIGYGELPERKYYCGMELHDHAEGCFDETGAVICGMEAHSHDDGCARLPEDFQSSLPLICTITDHAHTQACYGEATADFTYENGNISLVVHVVSDTGLPEGLSMMVTALESGDQSYASYQDYATENGSGELLDLVGYEIRFYLAGQEIELPDARITAELTVKSVDYTTEQTIAMTTVRTFAAAAADTASTVEETDETAEAEDVVVVTVLQEDEDAVSESGSITFEGGSAAGTVVKLDLGTGRTIALASTTAPTFKVEYYANLPLFVSSKTKDNEYMLQVIDTRGDGTGTGGDLPNNVSRTETGTQKGYVYLQLAEYGTANQNNTSVPLTGSAATDVDGKSYRLASQITLTQIYDTDSVVYSAGLNTVNLNKIRENDHYVVAELWVSQDDGQTFERYGTAAGVDHQISDLAQIQFTNNPASEDKANGVILVTSSTVLRFVNDVKEGSYSNSTSFFDYDISNGIVQNGAGYTFSTYNNAVAAGASTVYMNTYLKGINQASNYVASSTVGAQAYFAFGNNNTSTGRGTDTMNNGTYINQINNGFKGCSFGLVTGYDILTNTLQYASGIAFQPLFNDELYYRATQGTTVQGKTSYSNNYLDFIRVGDTYILDSVNGSSAINGITESNLSEFFVPNSSRQYSTKELLFTNNFWPMDGTAGDDVAGKDMIFGEYYSYTNGKKKYTNGSGSIGSLALSDDYNNHNSYFGMQYAVEFHLDGHYCGPLDYLFYGDDDMWVFLTDLSNGETKLICDIGGVHSSVGSYTDLWDYIDHSTVGDFVLTFFYTERGSSGSSCYMSFTLPQVTSITQNSPETGSVSVTKQAVGVEDAVQEFAFLFELSSDDPDVAGIHDHYTYLISGSGDPYSGVIDSGDIIKLKAGQTVTISGIPAGMTYTITEQTSSGYDVHWSGDLEGGSVTGTIVSSKITAGQTHSLVCTNTAVGSLSLTKEVHGADTGTQTFAFDVTLTNTDGTPVNGTYGDVTFAEGKAVIEVQHGQTVTLTGIPAGVRWTITEQARDGFTVEYLVDGVTVTEATGTITHNQTVAVKAVNTTWYLLPATGGMGIQMYAFSGLLLILAAALIFGYSQRRKMERGTSR